MWSLERDITAFWWSQRDIILLPCSAPDPFDSAESARLHSTWPLHPGETLDSLHISDCNHKVGMKKKHLMSDTIISFDSSG